MIALKKDVLIWLFIFNIVVNVITLFACYESCVSSYTSSQLYDHLTFVGCE
jgi:hypothetical protein